MREGATRALALSRPHAFALHVNAASLDLTTQACLAPNARDDEQRPADSMNRQGGGGSRAAMLALLLAASFAVVPPSLRANTSSGSGVENAPETPPPPLTGFSANFQSGFVIDLAWDAVAASANGVVIERCWPQANAAGCELAAALHPDTRVFEYHAIQPWQFRAATFNAHGVSAFSPLSPVVGEQHAIDLSDPAPLDADDSALARRIRVGAESSLPCTSPHALILEGLTLVAVREHEDLYRGPAGECGTGGCPYASFTVTDGCYHLLDGWDLYSQAPYLGRPGDDHAGVRLANSSGRACEGYMTVFQQDAEVDAYDWFGCYDEHLPSLRVPFNPRGLQRPDVPR
ncbi:MAG: hypothetical protein ACT4NL_06215 [Pseudomarimonas sp.]